MDGKELETQFNKDIMKAFGLDKLTEDELKALNTEYELESMKIRSAMEQIKQWENNLEQIAIEMIQEKFKDELKGTTIKFDRKMII